jgi:hypothetical protein
VRHETVRRGNHVWHVCVQGQSQATLPGHAIRLLPSSLLAGRGRRWLPGRGSLFLDLWRLACMDKRRDKLRCAPYVCKGHSGFARSHACHPPWACAQCCPERRCPPLDQLLAAALAGRRFAAGGAAAAPCADLYVFRVSCATSSCASLLPPEPPPPPPAGAPPTLLPAAATARADSRMTGADAGRNRPAAVGPAPTLPAPMSAASAVAPAPLPAAACSHAPSSVRRGSAGAKGVGRKRPLARSERLRRAATRAAAPPLPAWPTS